MVKDFMSKLIKQVGEKDEAKSFMSKRVEQVGVKDITKGFMSKRVDQIEAEDIKKYKEFVEFARLTNAKKQLEKGENIDAKLKTQIQNLANHPLNQKVEVGTNNTYITQSEKIIRDMKRNFAILHSQQRLLPGNVTQDDLFAIFKAFPEASAELSSNPIVADRLTSKPKEWTAFSNELRNDNTREAKLIIGAVKERPLSNFLSKIWNLKLSLSNIGTYISSSNKQNIRSRIFGVFKSPEEKLEIRRKNSLQSLVMPGEIKTELVNWEQSLYLHNANVTLNASAEELEASSALVENNLNTLQQILSKRIDNIESVLSNQDENYRDLHTHHFFSTKKRSEETSAIKLLKEVQTSLKGLQKEITKQNRKALDPENINNLIPTSDAPSQNRANRR